MKSKTPELLAGAILVAEAYCTSDCASYPLSLEVGNVTLDTGQIARGVVIGIGNPSQPMAFLPQMYESSANNQMSTNFSLIITDP